MNELPTANIDTHMRKRHIHGIEKYQIPPLQPSCINGAARLRPLQGAAGQHVTGNTAEHILHQPAAIKTGIKCIAAKAIRRIDGQNGARHGRFALACIQQ